MHAEKSRIALRRYAILAGSLAIVIGPTACDRLYNTRAPADKDKAAKSFTMTPEEATKAAIYVHRPSSLVAAAQAFRLRLNDQFIVDCTSGTFVRLVVEPGMHVIGVGNVSSSTTKETVTVELNEGETSYVKLTIGASPISGIPQLSIVDEQTAQPEIRSCNLIECQGQPATSAELNSRMRVAAGLGEKTTVAALLERGADVNSRAPGTNQVPPGGTALMLAAARNHVEMVEFLLAKGADLNLTDQGGGTALIYASWKGNAEIVRVLLDHGADPAASTRDGRTALSVARKEGHPLVVALLEGHRRTPAPPGVPTSNPARAGDLRRTCKLANYSFEVPLSWEGGGPNEEQHMREMLSVDPAYKVGALSTFATPAGAGITVYQLGIPTGQGQIYVERLLELNNEKFRQGQSSGLVKAVHENRRTEINDFEALVVEWESTRGDLPCSRQWVLHDELRDADHVVVLVAFWGSQNSRESGESLDRVAASLRNRNGR